MIFLNKRLLTIILSTALVVALVLFVSNYNIEIKLEGEPSDSESSVKGTEDYTVDSHHGSAVPEDLTAFNFLLGKMAPDFTLESYAGEKVSLRGLRGKNVVIFFSEGLMCYPSCWNQIAAFGADSLLNSKSVILNVTVDAKSDWMRAVEKMPELGKAVVLFDKSLNVSKSYGVLTLPSSMHKGQYPGHSYVIIDKEGVVRYIRDDVQMGIRNDDLSREIDKL